MSRRATLALAVAAAMAAVPRASAGAEAAGAGLAIADFTRHQRYLDARMSPGGTYVAALQIERGRRSLVFVEVATRKAIWVLQPAGESTVGAFHWANDKRVVVDMVDQDLALAAPVSRGDRYRENTAPPASDAGAR
jgi:hypothetical protein